MAEGFPSIRNELKIGYLNDHVDKFLQIYLNKFDIVIVEDQTFDIPNAVLKAIFQKFN
jgi:5'-nucleotidase